MLVDLQTGACFELNRVGADVWERMAAGATLGDTVEAMREKYSIPRMSPKGTSIAILLRCGGRAG